MTATSGANVALPPAYRLGEYVIESVLGQGGFGITYLARDTKLSSRVAIKEYFPQAFAFRDQRSTINARPTGEDNYTWGLQEFLKEARALAKFKHNHIVRVLRFLEANGTAYMVMEYEEGESLDQHLRKSGGFLKEAMLLGIFLPILSGLQAVHDMGLLHLDIKPENIYLRTNGQPMLIDFGSARRARARAGHDQKVALTPGFAAPEQYPNLGKQGPWSDVYSMGASLYRCVTGQQPVDALERVQSLRQRKVDPHRPATSFERPLYVAHIRECIDWALKLSPQERPQSAYALQHGLMGQGMRNDAAPTQQGAPLAYRSGFIGISRVITPQAAETVKRGLFAQAVIALLALVTAGVFSILYLLHTQALNERELYEAVDQGRAWMMNLIEGRAPATHTPAPPAGAAKAKQRRGRQAAAAPFQPQKASALSLPGHVEGVGALAFLLQGRLLACASAAGPIRLWDVQTGAAVRTLEGKAGLMAAAADGRSLAFMRDATAIAFWDAKSETLTELGTDNVTVTKLALSPDGRTLAVADENGALRLWAVQGKGAPLEIDSPRSLSALAFAPDGRRLATADAQGEIRYWETATGKLVGYFQAHDSGITALAFSPDGKWLATGGPEGFLKLWDTGIERRDHVLTNAPDTVQTLVFSPDGEWLIVGGSDSVVRIHRTGGGGDVQRLHSEHPKVAALAVSPDGALVATAGAGELVQIWK